MHRLFLIRHGEPQVAWDGGAGDPGLSLRGLKQAERAAAALRERGRLAAVSSPMLRCRETAARFAAAPLLDPRVSEITAPPGAERRAWLAEHFPWREPSRRRFWANLDPQLLNWREQALAAVRGIEADAAVFTHFIAINAIVGAALRRDETIVCVPDYASITELTVDAGELVLVGMGAQMRQGEVR
jgi:broad specificity phosphatase PhoE